jgi:two-component system, OmpR family, sensor histidine kinase KdpD
VQRATGLPQAELDQIFEPFYRRDQRAGTGLGLAIARGFAEVNGGRLSAESRPGQGATFVLTLPRAQVPAELERA